MLKPYLVAFIAFLFFVGINTSRAQVHTNTDTLSNQRAQNVFIELGSAGVVFSANYDTRFSKKRNGWGGRVGFSYWGDNGDHIYLFPIQVNYLFGRKKDFFEIGTGITPGTLSSDNTIFDDNNRISGAIGTVTAGFRRQAAGKGIFYKISLDGLYYPEDLRYWFGFCGIGLGYTFK